MINLEMPVICFASTVFLSGGKLKQNYNNTKQINKTKNTNIVKFAFIIFFLLCSVPIFC